MKERKQPREIVLELLNKNFEEFEIRASVGSFHTLLIRASGSIARLLHFETFAEKAEELLRRAPTEKFYAGMVTNIPRPDEVPERLRTIPVLSKLEKQYPVYAKHEVLKFVKLCSQSAEHIALCLRGNYDEAFTKFGSGVEAEEIASTLAVLGDFEKAQAAVKEIIDEDARQFGAMMVICLELFFAGNIDEALDMFETVLSQRLNGWTRLHFARGFSGRVPWGGYPYPDW